MSYTNPAVDPYPPRLHPDVRTPSDWLLMAYDNGWMRRESTTANRGYLANFREDHREDVCNHLCVTSTDSAHWPYAPDRPRFLGPTNDPNLSELFRQLMREELPTLSPLPEGVAA